MGEKMFARPARLTQAAKVNSLSLGSATASGMTISRQLDMTVSGLGVREAGDFERVLADFAQDGHGGLIVTPSPLTATKRDVLIGVAEKFKLPTVYPFRLHVESGGLVSYGIDQLETVREAASYVDRILRGANPADLPVQLPTKFSLVVNLKTAKGLGLTIPIILVVCRRSDRVVAPHMYAIGT